MQQDVWRVMLKRVVGTEAGEEEERSSLAKLLTGQVGEDFKRRTTGFGFLFSTGKSLLTGN